MKAKIIIAIALVYSLSLSFEARSQSATRNTTGYAPVNGLKMYYEIMGTGKPILLLHGAYMSVEGPIRAVATELAKTQQVYMVEMQGHGRTADIKRDLTYENLADDMASFAKLMKIDSLDVLGYSMGAGVAIQFAIRHPKLVKKIVSISGSYSDEGLQPVFKPLLASITPAMFQDTPFKKEYDSLAPNPKDFPVLVEKLKKLDMTPFNWEPDYVKIKKPVLLIFGDADVTTIEHAAKMLKGLGGNVMGDLEPMPLVQLAILPQSSHIGVMNRLDWMHPMISNFLK